MSSPSSDQRGNPMRAISPCPASPATARPPRREATRAPTPSRRGQTSSCASTVGRCHGGKGYPRAMHERDTGRALPDDWPDRCQVYRERFGEAAKAAGLEALHAAATADDRFRSPDEPFQKHDFDTAWPPVTSELMDLAAVPPSRDVPEPSPAVSPPYERHGGTIIDRTIADLRLAAAIHVARVLDYHAPPPTVATPAVPSPLPRVARRRRAARRRRRVPHRAADWSRRHHRGPQVTRIGART